MDDIRPVDYELMNTQFENFAKRVSEVFATKEQVSGASEPAKVFDTEADMQTWLAEEGNKEKLKVGQNLYIREENVPDYWWDGTKPQPLESPKVDLDGYISKDDFATENIDFSGYFKSVDEDGDGE